MNSRTASVGVAWLVALSSHAQGIPERDTNVGAGYFIEAGSLTSNPPLVTYRIGLASGSSRFQADVAVNCVERTRKESNARTTGQWSSQVPADASQWRPVYGGTRQ